MAFALHPMRWSRFFRCLLLMVATLALQAQAEDLVLTRSVLEDPSGQLNLPQILEHRFKPYEGMLSQGFSKSAFWVRLEVRPRADGGPVKLRVLPIQLEDVRLYDATPDHPDTWPMRSSGNWHPFDTGENSPMAYGFTVNPSSPSSIYYLRIASSSTVLADIQAITPAESNRRDMLLSAMQMLYLGFMLFVLFWTVKNYLQRPDPITGIFSATQLFSVLTICAVMGYFTPFTADTRIGAGNNLAHLFLFVQGLLTAIFHRRFLTLLEAPRFASWAFTLLSGVFPIFAVLYLMGWKHEVLYANALSHAAFGLLVAWLGFTVKPKSMLSQRLVRGSYLLLSLALAGYLLPALGLISHGDRRMLLMVPLYFWLSAGLMLHLLLKREQFLVTEVARQIKDGELAQQQLALERQYAIEQERLTDMLTHELKTPLGVALMSLGAMKPDTPYLGRIRQALSTMNDVVDRTRLVELVRNKRLPTHIEQVNASERVYECIEACTDPERVKASVGFGLEVRTDSHLLGIIVANLIDNALKYSPASVPVEVHLAKGQGPAHTGLSLVVVNAVGAAGAPDPERVFTKYYRSTGAHSKTGSGLGLHLCQHLARLLGGQLSYRELNKHVEFELWLPSCES